MKYFELGQEVYCAIYGNGTVVCIEGRDTYGGIYTVDVEFSGGSRISYTADGRYIEEGRVVLSQKPIPPIVNEPLPEFNAGEILAYFDADYWKIGQFYSYNADRKLYHIMALNGEMLKVSKVKKPNDVIIRVTTKEVKIG